MTQLSVVAEKTLGQLVAKEIENTAKRLGIKQKKLLELAKMPDGSPAVGATAFIDWKNGTTSPTVDRLEALCAVLGKKLDVRIGGESVERKRSTLEPEAVEAAEHINLLETPDRIYARDAVIRLADSLRQKKAKTAR